MHPQVTGTNAPLQVVLEAGSTTTSDGNTLAMEHVDAGIPVVVTPDLPTPTVTVHHALLGRRPHPTSHQRHGYGDRRHDLLGDSIHRVAYRQSGNLLPNRRRRRRSGAVWRSCPRPPAIYTPENGTCALLDSGTGLALANQSFLCRYNTRTADTGTTYQVIVGTGTTDTARQPLAPEFASSVMLNVTTGTATLSIADVDVNEGAGTATVIVTVDDAVTERVQRGRHDRRQTAPPPPPATTPPSPARSCPSPAPSPARPCPSP